MKPLIYLSFTASLFFSCTDTPNDNAGITGIYARQFSSEFGEGWDTVFVDADPGIANNFLIRHSIQTIRSGSDKVIYPEQKELVLPATWSSQHNELVSNKLGRRYTFPEQGVLMLGTARYKRIE